MLQRQGYVRALQQGGEKFNDINEAITQQTFRATDDAMRVFPKHANG